MLFSNLFVAISLLWAGVIATSNNLTDVVTWDPYSLMVNGNRLFVFSGEFHYQRMPVPELWPDIFQKLKANGFNAISIYFFWSYHSPSPDVYDFETSGKNVQRMLDYAKGAGLYVIARAGPYCNAETNAGGLALWGSDGSMGTLRESDATFHEAWLPWITNIGTILANNQITNGGPVILNQIENELQETVHSATNTLVEYMEQVEAAFLAANVTIPSTSNEKGERSMSWSTDFEDVGGAVNVYGLDSYPGGFSCTNINTGFVLVRNYYQWFSNFSFTQPSFFAEFEGGFFQGWGGSFYDQCLAEHDPEYADVYYKNNIGQRATMQNLYMAWGGTNWGHSAAPVVYTSYDYSAPLRETRQITPKLYQIKLLGLFTRVSTDLLKTFMVGNGTGFSVSSTDIWSWVLQNPDTGSGFYVVQQSTSSSRASVTFDVFLNTSLGPITASNVNLNGRQSKLLVTDYSFGNHTLLYSSADVLTHGIFDVDVLVLYLEEGQVGQFAFKESVANTSFKTFGNTTVTSASSNGTQSFTYAQAGPTVVQFSNGILVYLLDLPSAWKFWAPPTTPNPDVGADEQIFVLGSYLVRNASTSGATVSISGDNDNQTTIEVYTGDPQINSINWNGIALETSQTPYGSLTATIPGTLNRTILLPALTEWKSNDSLPEINPSYDDSHWTICNKTTTLSPVAPLTLPVLFSSDYGFYTGIKIYRGYFNNLNSTSVTLTCSGGLAFGWNAWLNGQLLGGSVGNATLTTTAATLSFSDITLLPTNNVITVVVDYNGHDETSTTFGVANPRGILGASLDSGTFTTWKITGNAGGNKNIDPVRGPMNEGGLYGERLGWHLPNFPASQFPSSSSPLTGLTASGIQFYITTFALDVPSDLDVPLGILLGSPTGTNARVQIFVNGYQYGKFVPQIGPQTAFPIPPGILNNQGNNTLAISLWAQTDEGAVLSAVELIEYGKYVSDFGFSETLEYLQPGWVAGSRDAFA